MSLLASLPGILQQQPSGGGGSAPTFVQSASASSSPATFSATPTGGNTLIVCTAGSTNPTGYTSLTSAGYTLVASTNRSGFYSGIFKKTASSDGTTVTISESMGTAPSITALEFTTTLSGTAVSTTAITSDLFQTTLTVGPTSPPSGSYGVAVATVNITGTSGSEAMSGGFTALTKSNRSLTGYLIQTPAAAAQTTFTWTTSRGAAACVAVFV